MDPVMKEIYRAYFERDYWKVAGIAEHHSLTSALQMKIMHCDSTKYRVNSFRWIKMHNMIAMKAGLKLVRKYSVWTI